MAPATKRMSAEEKKECILGIYHGTKDVYTEKEVRVCGLVDEGRLGGDTDGDDETYGRDSHRFPNTTSPYHVHVIRSSPLQPRQE